MLPAIPHASPRVSGRRDRPDPRTPVASMAWHASPSDARFEISALAFPSASSLTLLPSPPRDPQDAVRDRHDRAGTEVQGRRDDRVRYPRCVPRRDQIATEIFVGKPLARSTVSPPFPVDDNPKRGARNENECAFAVVKTPNPPTTIVSFARTRTDAPARFNLSSSSRLERLARVAQALTGQRSGTRICSACAR